MSRQEITCKLNADDDGYWIRKFSMDTEMKLTNMYIYNVYDVEEARIGVENFQVNRIETNSV